MAGAKSPLTELLCGICQDDLLESGADLGELDACRHRFCFPCISKWAAIENSCPFCKVRFARLRRKRLAPRDVLLAGAGLDPASELPGVYVDTQQVEERNQRAELVDPTFQQWIESLNCTACGGGEDEDQLLLCDECDCAFHTYCVGVRDIPEGEWYCPACSQRRAARASQRQRSAAEQPRRRGEPRRRAAAAVVDLSSSQEEDGVEGGRAAARSAAARRGGAVSGGRPGAGRGAAAIDDLSDFIVPDESGDDWLASEPRPAPPRRRGQRGRQRALPSDSGSEESTHERFGDTEPEADFTDSSGSGEADEDGADAEDQRPLLTRLQRRAGGSRRGGRQRPRPGAGRQAAAAAEGEEAPTQAHRNVSTLARHWDDLRMGSTTFAAVTGSTQAAAQPRRRRLVRAGQRGSGAAGAGGGGGAGGAEVVDLLSSQSPSAEAPGEADERQAWRAMDSALRRGGEAGRPRRRQRGRQAPSVVAGGDTDDELDVPLAVRLTREIAAARERGAQLVSRQPLPSPGGRLAHRLLSPPTGQWTVGELKRMSAAARGTPGSARPHGRLSGGAGSGGAGRPAPAIQPGGGGGDNPFSQYQHQTRSSFSPRWQAPPHGGHSRADRGRVASPSREPLGSQRQQPLSGRSAAPGTRGRRVEGSPEPVYRSPQPGHPAHPQHRAGQQDRAAPQRQQQQQQQQQQQPGAQSPPWRDFRAQRMHRPQPAQPAQRGRQPPAAATQQQQQQRQPAVGGGGGQWTPDTGGPSPWAPTTGGSPGPAQRWPQVAAATPPHLQQPSFQQQQPSSRGAYFSGVPPTPSSELPQGRPPPPPPQQQQPGAPGGALTKAEVLDRIKPLLKLRMARGELDRESYKRAAKAATADLFGLQRPFSAEEAQGAVALAVLRA